MDSEDYLANHPRYTKVKALNKGAYGEVVLCMDNETQKQVAIKFIERGQGVTESLERELATHRLLSHPHIIKFRHAFLTPSHLAIVLEFANGGDMYDYVVSRKRLGENRARWIFQQLTIAIDYLHSMKIASRDVKLENTLLSGHPDKPLVKICDLGFAKSEDLHSVPNSMVGTPAYLAPEVISCAQYNGYRADIWSMGVMLYVMLVGQYPFERSTDKALPATRKQAIMIDRILKADYVVPDHIGVGPEVKDLLAKMLTVNPEQRISIPEIQMHAWFQTHLPPGVLEMNKKLKPAQCQQSLEELQAIVRQAQQVGSKAAGQYDDMVDMMM